MKVLAALSFSLLLTAQLKAAPRCLGKAGADLQVIYLHGFIHDGQTPTEEGENEKALMAVVQTLGARIAMPEGPRCPGRKRCWPAKTAAELETSWAAIQKSVGSCLNLKQPYTLLGFSNGGYFAFKAYKQLKDPALTQILAGGSAGVWDSKADADAIRRRLVFMMGRKDITLAETRRLVQNLGTRAQLETFDGGHRLDEATLLKVLRGL